MILHLLCSIIYVTSFVQYCTTSIICNTILLLLCNMMLILLCSIILCDIILLLLCNVTFTFGMYYYTTSTMLYPIISIT